MKRYSNNKVLFNMKKLTMAIMAASAIATSAQATTTVSLGQSKEVIDVNPFIGEITVDMTGVRVQHEFDNGITATAFYKNGMPDRVLQDRQTRTEVMVGTTYTIKSVDVYGDIGYGRNQDSESYKIANGGAFIPFGKGFFAHANYLYRAEAANNTLRTTYYLGYQITDSLVLQAGTGKTTGTDYDMKHTNINVSYIF